MGRWVSRDSAEDGINHYAFVVNDPFNLVDVLGLYGYQSEADWREMSEAWSSLRRPRSKPRRNLKFVTKAKALFDVFKEAGLTANAADFSFPQRTIVKIPHPYGSFTVKLSGSVRATKCCKRGGEQDVIFRIVGVVSAEGMFGKMINVFGSEDGKWSGMPLKPEVVATQSTKGMPACKTKVNLSARFGIKGEVGMLVGGSAQVHADLQWGKEVELGYVFKAGITGKMGAQIGPIGEGRVTGYVYFGSDNNEDIKE